MSKKEIATKETTALSTEVDALLGGMPDIDPNDLMIPRLLLLQPTSQLEGNAGEIIDRNVGGKVGGNGEKLNFIPLTFFKTWEHFKKAQGDGQRTWTGREMWGPDNAHLPWNEKVDGIEISHDQTLNFYVMLERDLSNPMAMPYMVKFTRTGYQSGKKLLTAFQMARSAKFEPWSFVFALDSHLEKDDKRKYYELDVTQVLDTTTKQQKRVSGEALENARKWAKIIIENQAVITKRTLQDEDETPTQAPRTTSSPTFNASEPLPF